MIIDFEHEDFPKSWTADVCIVGAGAAGLTLAHELLRRGKRVLVLEGGGRDRWERSSQALNKTFVQGHAFAGAHSGRFRCLGGTTSAWAGLVTELDDIDFGQREWIMGSGWPFPKAELAEFYKRAEEIEGTDGLPTRDEEVWSALGAQGPYVGEDLSIFFTRWCPQKKFARLFADDFGDEQLLIALHANVVEMLPSKDRRRIEALRVRTLGGKEAQVPIRELALCLGGIESARFLLNQSFAPWNANGLVGRHFTDHIQCFVGDVRGVDLTADVTPLGPWRIDSYLPKLRLSAEAQRKHRTLNVSGLIELDQGIYPTMRTGIKLLTGPISTLGAGELARMIPMAPAAVWFFYKAKKDNRVSMPWAKPRLSVYSEQSPLSESRIELLKSRDALGLRRASLNWQISELELHTIRTYAQLVERAFAAHGLGEIVLDADLMQDRFADRLTDQFHHCGATRMSSDPQDGVVDTNLRLHGVDNAYVCSSSVFPSSGFVNPTHTIIALAARLGHRLAENAALERAA